MTAARWLREGSAVWGRSEPLRSLAYESARPGFAPAMAWMAAAMRELRGESQAHCADPARAARVAWAKYALAGTAGLGALVSLRGARALALPAAALAFYAVETPLVFAVPLALDGEPHPLRASRALVARWGGTGPALREVLPIAGHMLAGGSVRAWCEGCLAVLGWYEEARALDAREQQPSGAFACAT